MLENDATIKRLVTKTAAKGAPTGEKACQLMVQLAKDVDDGKVKITYLKQEKLDRRQALEKLEKQQAAKEKKESRFLN